MGRITDGEKIGHAQFRSAEKDVSGTALRT
jgi:hypothetical protein